MFIIKKLFLTLTLSIFIGLLSSCATIIRDNNQIIPINSNAENVDIKITNKTGKVVFKGQTPIYVNLKASKEGYFSPEKYTLEATKAGYETNQTVIDWHISKWYSLGNLGFGCLLGYLIVDPITGSMYYLDEEVNINMTPIKR